MLLMRLPGHAAGPSVRDDPPRLVLDTNVALSALLFHAGSLSWLRRAWLSGDIRPLVSRGPAEELIRVLAYPKFRLTDEAREDLLGEYLPCCEAVGVPGAVSVPDCRDPCDRPFLELSLAAKADALVTGDKDLLALADDFPVPIITPAVLRDSVGR